MNAAWKSPRRSLAPPAKRGRGSYGGRAALGALCAALLALAAVTVAQAKGPRGGHAPRPVLAAVHADVTVIGARGASKQLTWDKGTVKSRSDTSITLERKDGKSVTLAINAQTKTRGTVEVGKPAVVFSHNNTATAILGASVRSNAPAAPNAGKDRRHGRSPFGVPRRAVHVDWSLVLRDGKTLAIALDRGEVTAKSGTSITLKRPDGPSVTFTIDLKTKIRAKDGAIDVGDRAEATSQNGTALAIRAGRPKS